jgi:LysR family transcriptional regulator, salicylic acid-responsive activator of bsdBCD
MDLRQLRYFKEIVNQGSISKAAEVLHMAQPPLSMLLKQLEKQYGTPLIKRYRQKWEITEAGKMLYNHANQMLQRMEMFDAKMDYMKQGEVGLLRLGVSSSCLHLVGDFIRQFTQTYPKVELQIIKGDSEKLQQMLYDNEVDIDVILAPENSEQYEEVSLTPSPFALAVPKKWSNQFDFDMKSMQRLEQFPFISLEAMEGYSMLEKIMHHFNEKNVALNIVTKCKDISVAQYLVAKEVGISILPKVQLGYGDEIHFLDLPDFKIAIQPKLLYKQEATFSPICRNFIALFK